MSDFARYAEFENKLSAIREHFEARLGRQNGAVIVRNSKHQSIGVTRLLSNYYKPSAEEFARINRAEDAGRERTFSAFKAGIDKETFGAKFRTIVDEQRFEHYDSSMTVDDSLFEHQGLVPIDRAEYLLGSPSLVVRELPSVDAALKHLTGSIDRLRYNKRTGRLALIELKSGQTRAPYMKMRALYLKEKHCKQLTLYAFMLRIMASEANISLEPNDIELFIIGYDSAKHCVSVWQMQYDPQTFLGSVWAGERWAGIIDTGLLARLTLNEHCCIPNCTNRAMLRSKLHPDQVYCSQACREKPHCPCGKPATHRNSQRYFCRHCTA